MNWSSQLARIRRMLRDPNGRLWTDAQLKNMYNQEQQSVVTTVSGCTDVKVSRIPPWYRTSYCYDWEWGYSDYAYGDVIQWGYFDDSYACCYTYLWESQEAGGIVSNVPAPGEMWVHPFEAWFADTPAESPPIPAPSGFHKMNGIYWDKQPISAMTMKEVMDDPSWRTRAGNAMAYYRDSKLSDFIILYPLPAVVDWLDDFDVYLLTQDYEFLLTGEDEEIEV